MPRPSLPQGEARTVTLRFRVTPSEADEIRRRAGYDVSEWIRGMLLADVATGTTPPPDTVATEPHYVDEAADDLERLEGTE